MTSKTFIHRPKSVPFTVSLSGVELQSTYQIILLLRFLKKSKKKDSKNFDFASRQQTGSYKY